MENQSMKTVSFLLLLVCGCTSGGDDSKPEHTLDDAHPEENSETSVAETGMPEDTARPDTGSTEPDPPELPTPVRFEGLMAAEYTYSGSLGEFTDVCEGDAFITIDADELIAGEGTCANAIISFGFVIDGTRRDDELSGNLIGESAAGRAETPYAGGINDGQTILNFDHTHAADGESLRLVGTVNLVLSE
jgi:hypothetical protein